MPFYFSILFTGHRSVTGLLKVYKSVLWTFISHKTEDGREMVSDGNTSTLIYYGSTFNYHILYAIVLYFKAYHSTTMIQCPKSYGTFCLKFRCVSGFFVQRCSVTYCKSLQIGRKNKCR